MPSLPHLTEAIEPVEAEFRSSPDDFVVDEIPAYAPSGAGEHIYAWIEKRNLTTPQAVRRLCEHARADPTGAGWAGLKDRHAVTRQWVSVFGVAPESLSDAELEGVRVLEVARHTQKLRTGHLKGNRFRVRLRKVDPAGIARLREVLVQIEALGLPNYYGEQRFGKHGDNALRAVRWVRGERRPPRKPFQRKLELSALQSELFNRRVAARLSESALGLVYEGDLMKKHDTGGLFVAEHREADQARADRHEISPTGPIFGPKMRWPTLQARIHEEALLRQADLTPDDFARWKRIGPGTRRFVRVFPSEVRVSVSGDTVELDFTLPAGSYATILIREIRKRDASVLDPG